MTGQLERIIELNKLSGKIFDPILPNLISVFSGKGGTGKTFISANLAYAVAQKNQKVLLIDFDSNLSNIQLLFNTKFDKTLYQYFTNKDSLTEVITNQNKFLDIIFGDSGRLDYPKLDKSVLQFFLKDLKSLSLDYDFIIIDLGSGASDEILYLAQNSALNLLVTNPEPTAIIDAYVMIKLLKNENYFGSIKIIMNKCLSQEEGVNSYANLKTAVDHFLQMDISSAFSLLHDCDVHQSIVNQKLYMENKTDSSNAKALIQFSSDIIKFGQVLNINQSQLKQIQPSF